ncbi:MULTISPECIES: hypothetical protein [Streptomyces]|uniref:hypothetical protein n=1 Tax=Streptomyces TaxID=1883 RepID=UPI00160447F3|nr:hypothetical protein [Streptomyces sp. gCLA4]MBZ9593727.1 hypothetical protein [Streptomyces erythrochromogenes]
MEAVLASFIAVTGTLLGSFITLTVQRRASAQAEVFTRAQQLRQERLTTYSAYAGSVTALKRATVTLWFRLQEAPDGPEAREAFAECDRLGAATENAQFHVRLLAADSTLVALAAAAFDAIGPLRAAPTRTVLADRERDLQDALDAFVTAATAQVH